MVTVVVATVRKNFPKKQPINNNGVLIQTRTQVTAEQVKTKVFPVIEFIALNEGGEKFPFHLPISVYLGYEDESSFSDRLKFKKDILQKAKNSLEREDIVEVI